ncbi:FMN-linked oxidoreductase, partial [Martensiomyces pterosporus]
MIDVTDPCFLRLLRLISPFGHHQLWTEMIHANAFSRGQIHLDRPKLAQNVPLRELQDFSQGIVVQIGASSPSDAHMAVNELGRLGVRHVNLNCGCPSRNVQMGSFGAVLMKTPEAVRDIVAAMVDAAADRDAMQISVKCRIGIDEDESPEFLRRFIDTVIAGGQRPSSLESRVSFVLHTRRAWLSGLSPEQNRTVPKLNYGRAYEMVKEFPRTSFVVNGGISTVEAVSRHLAEADGVMVGRKIREDPWFLAELDRHIY